MVKAIVLVLVLLSSGRSSGHLISRDLHPSHKTWPCPNPEDIYPCECSTDADSNLDMDCSRVLSSDQLEHIFQAQFTVVDFRSLNITHSKPSSTGLDTIRAGMFGLATFQHIYITGTNIEEIDEEAFSKSHQTLLTLDASNNHIRYFPAETVPLYIHLWYLNLAGNYLPALPNIVSNSLRVLHLEGNLGLSVSETTFAQIRLLEELYLQDMKLGNIPPNVFSELFVIRIINMASNNYLGLLSLDFVNGQTDSLEVLNLQDNEITDIHPGSMTGLARSATVDFRNNKLTLLEKNNWFDLLEQVIQDDAIDLRDNNLLCGCDVFWLVMSRSMMRKIHRDTRCRSDGPRLHDLPPDFFIANC